MAVASCRISTRSGFTLVELIVIIAILGMLITLLLPVFARSRQQARVSVCVSNLRQIGLAVHAYQADYDGELPSINPYSPSFSPETTEDDGSPRNPLAPYGARGALFHCPQSIHDPQPPAAEAGSYCTRFVFSFNPNTGSNAGEVDSTVQEKWRMQPEASSVILYCPAAVRNVVNCNDMNHGYYPPGEFFTVLRGDGAVVRVPASQIIYRAWDWGPFAGKYTIELGDAYGPYGLFPNESWPPKLTHQATRKF